VITPAAIAECMTLHLEEISTQVSPGACGVLICDGAGWHQRGGEFKLLGANADGTGYYLTYCEMLFYEVEFPEGHLHARHSTVGLQTGRIRQDGTDRHLPPIVTRHQK
jgi:hypothetical protein